MIYKGGSEVENEILAVGLGGRVVELRTARGRLRAVGYL